MSTKEGHLRTWNLVCDNNSEEPRLWLGFVVKARCRWCDNEWSKVVAWWWHFKGWGKRSPRNWLHARTSICAGGAKWCTRWWLCEVLERWWIWWHKDHETKRKLGVMRENAAGWGVIKKLYYINSNVAPCGACRPWIFFINGVFSFLKFIGSGMEKEERWLETSLQGEDESRTSSPP